MSNKENRRSTKRTAKTWRGNKPTNKA